MSKTRLAALLAIGSALVEPCGAESGQGVTLKRELEGFATATCLVEQKLDPYLQDQGYRWSAIAVQGRAFSLAALAPISAAVKARLAEGDMVVVRDEQSPSGDKPLPLVFCARIVDAPKVRAGIGAALKKLEPAGAR